MLSFKKFRRAKVTIAGIELLHRIRKNQFNLSKLPKHATTVPAIWNAVRRMINAQASVQLTSNQKFAPEPSTVPWVGHRLTRPNDANAHRWLL
jgi:hypothetical protein